MKSTPRIIASAIAVLIFSITVTAAAGSETFINGVTLAELFAQPRYYAETNSDCPESGTDCPETDSDCESATDAPIQLDGKCGDSLYWSLNIKSGLLEITGTGDMYDYSPIEKSPWYEYRRYIKSITIESGATSIGSYAFEDCPNLRNVTIPEKIKSIGACAFLHCKVLSGVNIPDSVTTLGSHAFYGCTDLLTVEIGNGIKKIEEYTFFECEYMQSLTLSEGLEEIGDYAFSYCRMLPSLTIPDSVKVISYAAFDNCHSIRNIKLSENLETIGGFAFQNCVNIEEIIIPDKVTSIGGHALDNCLFLKSIIIPNSTTFIGNNFEGCDYIQFVHIPPSVTELSLKLNASAFICSNTENCYAKEYALDHGIKFVVCNEEHTAYPDNNESETITTTTNIPETTVCPTTVTAAENTTNSVTAKIRKPSVDSVAYGDSIILHADVSALPNGWNIKWNANNSCFEMSVSETGSFCTVTPKENGSTVFSITVVDADGNTVCESEPIVLNAKAGLFNKILAFFKKLFGLTKILPEMIR